MDRMLSILKVFLTKVFLDDVTKYARGFIMQGVIGEIVSTCNQMEEYQNRT